MRRKTVPDPIISELDGIQRWITVANDFFSRNDRAIAELREEIKGLRNDRRFAIDFIHAQRALIDDLQSELNRMKDDGK